jgi:TIR domain
MSKSNWKVLFSDYDLSSILEDKKAKVSEEIAKLSIDQIMQNDVENLVLNLLKKLHINILFLHEEDISIDSEEIKLDVSQDFNRAIRNRSQPFYCNGIRITYYIPFSGDQNLFQCRPNSFTLNPPRSIVGNRELRFPYDCADRDIEGTKLSFQEDLNQLNQWILWVNQQVESHNNLLHHQINQEITSRRNRLIQDQKQVDNLGFKIRQKTSKSEVSSPKHITSSQPSSVNQVEQPLKRFFDVALSFAGEDREYVEEVATLLKQNNIKVFYDRFEEIDLWGKNLADHLGEVYSKKTRFVVMFVSQHYAAKVWTNYERQQAQSSALKSYGEYVLPARFDDTEVPGLSDSVAYLDLRKLTPKELTDRILAKLAPGG